MMEVVLGILSVILSAAAMVYIFYRLAIRGQKQMMENRAKATPAEATITGINQAGGILKVNRRRYTRVSLHLTLHDRFEGDRQAAADWWVDDIYLPQVQPGGRVNVKIGAGEDKNVYPDVEWAGVSFQDLLGPR